MRYIEYKGVIHQVFSSAAEWRKEGYAQTKLLNYLSLADKYPGVNIRGLRAKSFIVGKWVSIYTGKYQGVMRILSIFKKHFGKDAGVYFETCYGWARFGTKDDEFVFDPNAFVSAKKTVGTTPREYNFAASFALKGDLKQAYADNISSYDKAGAGSHIISKKKPLPYLSGFCKTLRYATSLESSMCQGN